VQDQNLNLTVFNCWQNTGDRWNTWSLCCRLRRSSLLKNEGLAISKLPCGMMEVRERGITRWPSVALHKIKDICV